MTWSYRGRVALVTGAGSPIGQAIVRRLTGAGASMVLADVVDVPDPDGDAPFVKYQGDLSVAENVERCRTLAAERLGPIDILVNNAGGGVIRSFLEHDAESLQQTLSRNLLTTILCAKAILPDMVANNYGRIVNIGAESVRNGLDQHAMYNAAKGGVHGLTTGLAREFAPHDITVNCVAPCSVATPRVMALKQAGSQLVRTAESLIPKGRSCEPDEVASMVAYLCLDEARFVTGQIISVNGGSSML